MAYDWRTLSTRDFFIFKKIRFDACLIDYSVHQLCLINEHDFGDFDRELAMVSLAIQETHASYRAILIARFSPPQRNLFIVRLNQPTQLSATLHPVPPDWLDTISQKYELLDVKSNKGKNDF